jgi:hypothetical protein
MKTVTLIYSDKCGACKAYKPAFDHLTHKYRSIATFRKTTEGNVYAYPTTIVSEGGVEIGRVIGNNPLKLEKILLENSKKAIPSVGPRLIRPRIRRRETYLKEHYKKMDNLM